MPPPVRWVVLVCLASSVPPAAVHHGPIERLRSVHSGSTLAHPDVRGPPPFEPPGIAPAGVLELKDTVFELDGIVLVHRALVPGAENPVQILVPRADKGGAFLGCW